MLLERYRAAGGHIIHIVHQVPDGAPVFTPGSALAEEFDELAPREGEPVVTKKFPGSFAETELKEVLERQGVKKVVLAGYMVC
jgi:nicotinamidase-related amidase